MTADAHFEFAHRLAFAPADAEAVWSAVPAAPGVLALRGADPAAEPYLSRAADLRRRLRSILAPAEAVDAAGHAVPSRRLNLRDRIRWVEWTATGSDFESNRLLYAAALASFGEADARRRLRLHTPYCVRVTRDARHPRAYVTNRINRRALGETFGPFPSRAAAERYTDAVLDLFQLRRCFEELHPAPDHPGCIYGEIGKCLAPCREACTPARYSEEAEAVFAFFRTCGESMLAPLATQREAASEAMDFEAAASLHRQWERVHTAAALADEAVRPLDTLCALMVQPAVANDAVHAADTAVNAALPTHASDEAAVFLLSGGRIVGPARLSTLGVRAVRAQTEVGSSLFAQPLMLAAVPLGGSGKVTSGGESPEARARDVVTRLEAMLPSGVAADELPDTLSLFRRWYYRPEKSRSGACFFAPPRAADGSTPWPWRRILNAAARAALGPPEAVAPVDRTAAAAARKELKTRTLHAGREGVEREVPIVRALNGKAEA